MGNTTTFLQSLFDTSSSAKPSVFVLALVIVFMIPAAIDALHKMKDDSEKKKGKKH